ncbi:uncharacterized protein BDW70DRAFT_169597 [Aspergillus foveolatus]|uniref:uncharacterized protein n=1 Tax=Aspergillus foveolatus TaxID=210207 RepID=UPI003CCD4681
MSNAASNPLVGVAAQAYCTRQCRDSLQTFQEKIRTSCGKQEYELYVNSTTKQSPTVVADGLVWAYELSCIQDSSGFCLADLYNHTKAACSDCTLKYGAVMMSSDYGRQQFPPAAYSSLLASCSVPASSYPYTYTPLPTATPTSTTPTATPTPACNGKTYVSQQSDTCETISKANSVSTDRLIEANHLDYSCSSLTPGTPLCIEDTCMVYTVKANQTCQDIVRGQSFGLVQLIGWNPTIHQNCDNLDSMAGRSVCISPPGGGSFSMPDSSNSTSTGLASSIVTAWTPGETTTLTNLTTSWYSPTIDPSYNQSIVTYTANSTLSSLLAERTQYCWITDDDWDNLFNPDDLAQNCQSLYSAYCDPAPTAPVPGSSPAVPGSCTPVYSTAVPSSTPQRPSATSSGVPTPTPTQSGMADGCTKFHKVEKDEGCQQIADDYGIALSDFYAWNPAVGDDCMGLQYDYYVCVGKAATTSAPATATSSPTVSTGATPTPTQSGMTGGCTEFHKVEKDEGCQQIADDYGIALSNFYAWNPAVGDDCMGLQYDYYVCVGTSATAPTSTASDERSTTTTPNGATPTPVQSGMTSGCTKFHMVEEGEYCYELANDYGIALADFEAWNPAVGSNCEGLQYGYYVCMGTS